jgi:hypothetical protein
MSDKDGSFKVQVSLKDTNGDLFNLRGDSVAEVNQQIAEFADIIDSIKQTQSLLRAAGVVTQVMAQPVASPAPAAPMQAAMPAQTVAASPASGVLCEHGEPARLVPAGVSKSGPRAGQPYPAFYTCPRQRGDQCGFRANA